MGNMIYLSYIGGLSIIGAFGYLTYLMFTKVRFRNPIKRYIRKEVMNYLRELRDE